MRRIVTCVMLALGLAGTASAATINVTRFDDPTPIICLSGLDCTLREAVIKANADAGADVVQLPAGTFTLTENQLPTSAEDLTIQGAGATATTITGSTATAAASPAGAVIATTGGTLTIRGVMLSGNRLAGTAAIGAGAIAASAGTVVIERSAIRDNRSDATSATRGSGAIAGTNASLIVTDSAIEDNVFAGSGSAGAAGAIAWNSPSGVVALTRSSISRNRADLVDATIGAAAGAVDMGFGTMTIADSTVSANTVTKLGGTSGVGGITSTAVTTLANVTLTDNVTGGRLSGTAVGNLSLEFLSTKTLANTLVAGGRPNNCAFSFGSTLTSSGGNLEDANTCLFAGPGDRISTDPLLGALRNNGGLGLTQAPLPVSPAFGLARPQLCSASDQRGVARPVGDACDSGAFDGTPPPVNTALPSVSGTIAVGQTLTCSPGSWSGAPTFGFTWLRDGSAVPAETGTTHAIAATDLGTAVQCQVTASNVAGVVVATSAAVVSPVNTVRPAIAGIPRTGQRLTCQTGTWSGSPTLAVSWLRLGAALPGASSASYVLRPADVGRAIQCRVTATGPGGATVAESMPVVPAKACIVPALRGLTLPSARSRLAAAGCRVGTIRRRTAPGRPGRVLSSSPAAGRNLPAGARVGITLSKG